MGFLKRFLIKRALKKAASKTDMEKIADAVLKDAMQELQQTGRTADKILKAKLMRQESSHALNKIRELDEEFIDEDEETPSIEDNLVNTLIKKVLDGGLSTSAKQKGKPTSYDETGNPVYVEASQSKTEDFPLGITRDLTTKKLRPETTEEITKRLEPETIKEITEKLKPETVEELKKKFLTE